MKNIVLYFINWNDCFYLPFVATHYGKFCSRIVMLDNYSTDLSIVTAKRLGFDVQGFGFVNRLDDQDYLNIKNNCWKEQRGKGVDYVIVCDVDEFLKPIDLSGTFPRVEGFNMISNNLPVHSIFEINTGAPSVNYSKQVIFNPDAVEEINFVHGCHKHHASGQLTTEGLCHLYHFRQIGGVDRMLKRHALYRPRLSKFNLKHNMGHHYGRPEFTREQLEAFNNEKVKEWNELQSLAIELYADNV